MTKFVQDDIDDVVKKELIERKKKVYLTEKETDEISKFSDDDMKKLLKDIRNLGRNLKN